MKSTTKFGAIVASVASVAVLAIGSVSNANPTFGFTRLGGVNRFDTARLIATRTFASAPTAVLANAYSHADALVGAFVAGDPSRQAPVLLTATNSLPAETASALRTLQTTKVVVMGGANAVGEPVVRQLAAMGITVERLSGITRYDTAAFAARRFAAAGIGRVDSMSTAFVASGLNYADALAASPMSFASRLPIVLTDPASLPAAASATLVQLGIRQVIITGGIAAVSSAVEQQIRALGITVTRVSGANRQATAVALAEMALARLGFSTSQVGLARGDDAADALAFAARLGAKRAPLLFTLSASSLAEETAAYLKAHAQTLTSGDIAGGVAAISSSVEQKATSIAAGLLSGLPTASLGSRPELTGAQVVRMVSAAQASAEPVGVRVRFAFDEALGTALSVTRSAKFHVVEASGIRHTGSATIAPALDAIDKTVATVVFPTVDTAAEQSALSLATVDIGAVIDPTSLTNPTGSVPLISISGIPASGLTAGPDLRSVTAIPTVDGATGALRLLTVQWRFDEPITGTANAAKFRLLTAAGMAMACAEAATVGDADGLIRSVRCSSFRSVSMEDASAIPASIGLTDVAAAVMATVDDAAVVALDAGRSNAEAALAILR